jgi:hypothetical protein
MGALVRGCSACDLEVSSRGRLLYPVGPEEDVR